MALVTLIAKVPHPPAMAECRRLSLSWSDVSVLEVVMLLVVIWAMVYKPGL